LGFGDHSHHITVRFNQVGCEKFAEDSHSVRNIAIYV
jgi:hypothetical protein